jgi:hypothetical protein
MKNICMALGVAGVMAAPNLFAAMSVTLLDNGYFGYTANGYSIGNGGEFRAVGNAALDSEVNWGAYSTATKGAITTADESAWGGSSIGNSPNSQVQIGQEYFQTFCVEYNEEFSPGGLYTVSSIGDAALYNGHAPTSVPITLGVAYLYSQFALGKLGGYDYYYGSGRQDSAGVLQQAIWNLLGEGGALTGFAYNDLTNYFGTDSSAWNKVANGAFGVQVMVLGAPGAAQDQLVIAVPEPTTVIAGAMLLLPLGASTIRLLRKSSKADKDVLPRMEATI